MYPPGSPPISRDNKIMFINQGSRIRCPSERKTPPPPKWGDEENPGYNPNEPFYDRTKDPSANMFKTFEGSYNR